MPQVKTTRYFGLFAISVFMIISLLFVRAISGQGGAGLGATMWAVVAFFAIRGQVEKIRGLAFAMMIVVALAGLVVFSKLGSAGLSQVYAEPSFAIVDLAISFVPWLILFYWAEARENEQRRASLASRLIDEPESDLPSDIIPPPIVEAENSPPQPRSVQTLNFESASSEVEGFATSQTPARLSEDGEKKLRIALGYRADMQGLLEEAKTKGQSYVDILEESLLVDPRVPLIDVRRRLQLHEEQLNRPFVSDAVNDAWQEVKVLGEAAQEEFRYIVQTLGEDIDVDFVLKQLSAKFPPKPRSEQKVQTLATGFYFASSGVAFQVRQDGNIQILEFSGGGSDPVPSGPWMMRSQFAGRIGDSVIGDVIFFKNDKRKDEPIVRFPDGRLMHAITSEEFRTIDDAQNALGTQDRDRLSSF